MTSYSRLVVTTDGSISFGFRDIDNKNISDSRTFRGTLTGGFNLQHGVLTHSYRAKSKGQTDGQTEDRSVA